MRTRKRRFFIILLHLVGVSHYSSLIDYSNYQPGNIHSQQQQEQQHYSNNNHTESTLQQSGSSSSSTSTSTTNRGVVLPYPITTLERIDLFHELQTIQQQQISSHHLTQQTQQHQRLMKWKFWKRKTQATTSSSSPTSHQHSMTESIHVSSSSSSSYTVSSPIWLQDSIDGLCLGPMSTFTECGDATLWYISLPPKSIKQQHQHDHQQQPSSVADDRYQQQTIVPTSTTSLISMGISFRVIDYDYDILESQQHESHRDTGQQQQQQQPSRTLTNNRQKKRHQSTATSSILSECLDVNISSVQLEQQLSPSLIHVGSCHDDDVYHKKEQQSIFHLLTSLRNKQQTQTQPSSSSLSTTIWMIHQNGMIQSNIRIPKTTSTTTYNNDHNFDTVVVQQQEYDTSSTTLCISRYHNQAILSNCTMDESNNINNHHPVQFTFVRYHPTVVQNMIPLSSPPTYITQSTTSEFLHQQQQLQQSGKLHSDQIHNLQGEESDTLHNMTIPPSITATTATTITNTNTENNTSDLSFYTTSPILHNRDRAHIHASIISPHPTNTSLDGPSMHPELKIPSRLIFQQLQQQAIHQHHMNTTNNSSINNTVATITTRSSWFHRFLLNTNPILLLTNEQFNLRKSSSTSSTTSNQSSSQQQQQHLHHNSAAIKIRRIQTHPYLNEAKNGIWTDPITNLQYPTDLCHYINRNRYEHGRHTITGYGIYRKGYVIKVYGIAYYVSKRDVLMDPIFEPYASMTADQLRLQPKFYEILRKMRSNQPKDQQQQTIQQSNAGYFDRTIMLKTNMQLSTETMRSSLEADWSYLTDEMKHTLASTSMKQQNADEYMIQLIQSTTNNPSRCSCSQIAPEEYHANPDCCARGTELAFTWTKQNELEVRLDGRLMDTFPRPDIAEGIFYEYLRNDNPISMEFVDHVVDGFPFLLGPTAQIRGISIGKSSSSGTSDDNNHHKSNDMGAMIDAMMEFRNFIVSEGVELTEFMKHNMVHTMNHVTSHGGQMIKSMSESMIDTYKEVDRRRDLMIKHTVAAPEVVFKLLSRDEDTIQYFIRWMTGQSNMIHDDNNTASTMSSSSSSDDIPSVLVSSSKQATSSRRRGPRGRVFQYPISRWFGEDEMTMMYYSPDEIGPMIIHPTINKMIVTLVHLYLLLLFIVSFPGSYTTTTTTIRSSSSKLSLQSNQQRKYHPISLDDDSEESDDTSSDDNITKCHEISNPVIETTMVHRHQHHHKEQDLLHTDQFQPQLKVIKPSNRRRYGNHQNHNSNTNCSHVSSIVPYVEVTEGIITPLRTARSEDVYMKPIPTTATTAINFESSSSSSNAIPSGLKKKSLSYYL